MTVARVRLLVILRGQLIDTDKRQGAFYESL